MPFLKPQKQKSSLWKAWEQSKNREGYRGAVFGSSSSDKYTGWYQNNLRHGKGFQSYEDSNGFRTFYEGDWENDLRHGYGSLSFNCKVTKKSMRVYSGEWRYDKMTGSGMKSFPDGSLYKGEFKNGQRHGSGIMYYSNGCIYTGQWNRDLRHGVGRLLKKEDYYEGSFKNDVKCGLGRYHHNKKGQMQDGVWFRDQPQVTVVFDQHPNNRIDELTGKTKTEFDIPPLTILKYPKAVYVKGAHEVLDEIENEALAEQQRNENAT